jgi:hypothetical protein
VPKEAVMIARMTYKANRNKYVEVLDEVVEVLFT